MRVLYFVLFSICLFKTVNVLSQVGINTTTPNESSILDVNASNKGLLIPRVSLVSIYFSNPIMDAETSLLVYNTNEVIGLGYYYWGGSEWKKLTTPDDVSVLSDADFFRLGTTLSPTLITQGIYTLGTMGIGRNTTNATLDIEGSQIIGHPDATDENSLVINALGREDVDNSSVSLGSTGVDGNGVLKLYNNEDTRNTSIKLTTQSNSNSYIENAGTSLFGIGTTSPNLGKLEVAVNTTDTNTKTGLYVRNNGGYTASLGTFSIRTINQTNSSGTKYGLFSSITSNGNGARTGIYNSVRNNVSATGIAIGLRNSMTNLSGGSSKYGVFSEISAVTASIGDIYGMKNEVTGALGNTYGTYNEISAEAASSADLYGYYAQVDNDGTGTKYGGRFITSGEDNYGIKAENLTTGGFAGSMNGNTEIQNGYLTVGATTAPTLKTGSYTTTWRGNYSFDDDGYRIFTMGYFRYPILNTPSTVTVKRIKWKARAHHADGDEDHGVWVRIGLSGFYGFSSEAITSKRDLDWQYISPELTTPANYNQTIQVRLEDEDCGVCGDDFMRLDNIEVTIEYEYTDGLEEGDIAASGRVYANMSAQVGDLAEYFEVSNGTSTIGDIITLKQNSNNEYQVSQEAYSQYIVGVVSKNPSIVLNNPSVGPPVALAGRVKVKVAPDILVKSGDFLTTSQIPGLAMIATKMGPIIGYAVENQKKGENMVEILLQPGRLYIPRE